MKIWLVGLTPTDTPQKKAPRKTGDFDFLPYVDALNQAVPQAKSAGADVIVILANICHEEISQILATASQLGVAVIEGACCGQTVAQIQDGVGIVVPEPDFGGYGKVTFKANKGNNTFSNLKAQVKPNSGGSPDEEVAAVLDAWAHTMDAELSEVVGFASEQIPNKSATLHNLVMDSWLYAFPQADIARLNFGGVDVWGEAFHPQIAVAGLGVRLVAPRQPLFRQSGDGGRLHGA